MDGRGHSSLRLNFSASSEDEIREGIRRIGKIVTEQVALYGTLTGEEREPLRVRRTPAEAKQPPRHARVVQMPRRRAQGGR
jgi:2-aminoadipate transaminase